ncbi:hypothetical protein ACSBR2_035601 [Camellia fascicularis]
MSKAYDEVPSSRPESKKKLKMKLSSRRKYNHQWAKKSYFDLAKRYGQKRASAGISDPKTAIWRAAVAAISLSASIENERYKGRYVLNEAQATLKMGEILEIEYNGKEAEVLTKIVELAMKDMERLEGGNRTRA